MRLGDFVLLLTLVGLSRASYADEQVIRCQKNLTLIYEALEAYRHDHQATPTGLNMLKEQLGDRAAACTDYCGAFPESLEELVPKYLHDPGVLLCPNAVSTGENDHGYHEFIDASGPTSSYPYELSTIDWKQFGGRMRSLRDFKVLQLCAVDENVPIVRCFRHGKNNALNIRFDGALYFGAPAWEEDILHLRAAPYMEWDLLNKYPGPLQLWFPPKVITDEECLDLSGVYNALLGDPWIDGKSIEPLAGLMPRVITSRAIQFDVRGVTQLRGASTNSPRYPKQRLLRKRLKAKRIHFLHACAFAVGHGTQVASYFLTYLDGSQSPPIKILYGIHTNSSRSLQAPTSSRSTIAWQSSERAPERSCLFHLSIDNPHPEKQIVEMSMESSGSAAAPFVTAITISNEQE